MELVSKLKEMIPWKRRAVESQDVMTLRDDINRLFDRFFSDRFFLDRPWAWPDGDWPLSGRWPGLDVEETEEEVIVRTEMPGVDPKDLSVNLQEGLLELRYAHEAERRGNGDRAGYLERRYRAFDRSVALPSGLDTSRAKATCKHGLLTVRIPRSEEARQRIRRIPIDS